MTLNTQSHELNCCSLFFENKGISLKYLLILGSYTQELKLQSKFKELLKGPLGVAKHGRCLDNSQELKSLHPYLFLHC